MKINILMYGGILLLGTLSLGRGKDGLFNASDDTENLTPFTKGVDHASLESISNDNSTYVLTLSKTTPFTEHQTPIVLVIGEVKIKFSYQGYRANDYKIDALVENADLVKPISQLFPTTIVTRKHPGYRITTRFIPKKDAYRKGEDIDIVVRITNEGDKKLIFTNAYYGKFLNNPFDFIAESEQGDLLPEKPDAPYIGGLIRTYTIDSGKSVELPANLGLYFDFKKSGTYWIRGLYHMDIVRSAEALDSVEPIWDDYACSQFHIKIKD